MLVTELMTHPVVTVRPDELVPVAASRMFAHRISSVAVEEDGRLVGVLSRTDLLRVGRPGRTRAEPMLDLPHVPVRAHMTPTPITVAETATVEAVAAQLVEHRIHRVFVVHDNVPMGVVSARHMFDAARRARLATPISHWMSAPVVTAPVEESVSGVLGQLSEKNVTGIVIVEGNWPVGLFTQIEALAARQARPDAPVEDFMSPALLCLPEEVSMFRAAAQAAHTRAQRVLAVRDRSVIGMLTAWDFARAIAHSTEPS